MCDLQVHRVNTPNRPFIATGVDYTGGTSTYKGYIAIFVCLAMKAVHLEVVTGISSEHYLLAFSRFTGRRGPVQHMYSDNGTNFVGANKLLASAQQARYVLDMAFHSAILPQFRRPLGGRGQVRQASPKEHCRRSQANL